VRYFRDFVRPSGCSACPTRANAGRCRIWWRGLRVWDGGLDAEALQSLAFAVGKEHGFEPLRDWFKALYEVLLGGFIASRPSGPRLGGGFIALAYCGR
jgi:lysyl-tRNA synthetase, class I